jgi:hypothetical protein
MTWSPSAAILNKNFAWDLLFHTTYLRTQGGGKIVRTISQEDRILYVDRHGYCQLNCLILAP